MQNYNESNIWKVGDLEKLFSALIYQKKDVAPDKGG